MLIHNAKLQDLIGNIITIEIPKNSVDEMEKFRPNEYVTIEIKKPKDKRTLKQNAFIWEIIHQIDRKVNGFKTDEFSIYKELIKESKIKCIFIQTVEEAKKELEATFRYVEEIEKRNSEKGQSVLYRCYYGTSKFTKQEMTDFIEALIDRAYKEGIDICNYLDVLKG